MGPSPAPRSRNALHYWPHLLLTVSLLGLAWKLWKAPALNGLPRDREVREMRGGYYGQDRGRATSSTANKIVAASSTNQVMMRQALKCTLCGTMAE
jgi:hypothetical protein